jgi:hypothetical protein
MVATSKKPDARLRSRLFSLRSPRIPALFLAHFIGGEDAAFDRDFPRAPPLRRITAQEAGDCIKFAGGVIQKARASAVPQPPEDYSKTGDTAGTSVRYLRQKAGEKTTNSVNNSRRPRSIVALRTHFWKSVSEA